MKKAFLSCLAAMLVLLLALPVLAEEDPRIFVTENETLALYLKEDLCGFDVLDKRTGVTWSSSMNDPTFSGKLAGLNAKKANSLLTVNVTNLEKGAGSITNAVLLNDKQLQTAWEPIANGALLKYDLGANKIRVQVQVLLDGETVLVKVPYAGIECYGDFSVVSIDMMPFLCSGSDEAEGFLFYPDGSGAILEFKDKAHFKETTQVFNIYGSLEKSNTILDMFAQEEPTVMLPVYGVSIGGNAMIAVVEDGAETARISVNSSTKIVALNYVFANLQYRRGFDDLRVTTRAIKTYDKKAMETDYALRLMFLPEGKNDYSAMAVAYRNYLQDSGVLSARIGEDALAVDLFMSAPEEGLLFDTQRTVTTLSQAGEILEALQEAGVGKAQVSLKGWAKGGYGMTPDRLPVERAVGSNKELSALMDKAEKMGMTLSLTANFLEANADSRGYSKRNDVTYLSNFAILTDKEEEVFFLSPDAMMEKYEAFRKSASSLGLNGLRFERLGQMIGFNYNSGHTCTPAQCLDMYRQMMETAKADYGHVSVQGGALCLVPYADLMTEVPYEDSGFQFTTKAVPFYQMVMHGLRSYTGMPGNLSSDLDREILRWVEMGYMPYFELTHGSTEALMYTDYQSLFTAEYTAWLDEVAQVAHQFGQGDLAQLRTALMMQHDEIQEDLFRVRYDNGMTVYVNYSDEPVTADGVTIAAKGYLVMKEGQ